jgi:predicted DNA-binding transcriptional regulator YafY
LARPTARVLALLEILQAGGTFTVADLAARLGVDERTLRRYAAHLTELGIPVETVRGRYGGYRLGPGYKLPPLMLTDDEAVSVVLALASTPSPSGASATAKIRRVLPPALAARIDAMLSTVDITRRRDVSVASTVAAGTLLTLAEAARDARTVVVTYTNWRGTPSERRLDPYGLVLHTGRWYVTGHDHRRGEVRTFRLDRIGTVRLTGNGFVPPDGFDPAAHVLSGLDEVPYRHDVSVILRAGYDEVRSRVPGKLTQLDDGVRLEIRAERLDGAARMLVSLGWPFTVERPEALKDEVRALADRLYSQLN